MNFLREKFTSLGCNQKTAVITQQVYLELCEIKRYYYVQYYFDKTLNKIYITGKKTKNGPTSVFVPTPINENLSFDKMQEILTLNKNDEYDKFYLVIVHQDTTCVYYEIANKLLEPMDTTAKHLKENKQEKLDAEIRKNHDLLAQASLYGLEVTIPKIKPE